MFCLKKALLLTFLITSASATTNSTTFKILDLSYSTNGYYLVTGDKMALYISRADTALVSNCKTTCLNTWKPLTVKTLPISFSSDIVAGLITSFVRPDNNAIQITYNGS